MKKTIFAIFIVFLSNIFANEDIYELNVVLKNEKEFESNRSITSLSKDEIQKNNSGFIIDYYKEINGVFTQQTAAGQGSPTIRGLTGTHTLIVFDGIKVNSTIFRYGPNQYSAVFDPNIIGNIEILKGSEPVLYGSDAVGGVSSLKSINIDFNLRSRFGYDTANKSVNFHRGVGLKEKWGEGGFLFSANQTQNLEGGDAVGIQPFTSFENYSATGKIVLSPSFGNITLFGTYFTQKNGYRTDKSSKKQYRIYPSQDHSIFYLKHKKYFSKFKTSLESAVSYQYTLEELDEYKNNNGSFLNTKDYKDEVYQFGLYTKATTSVFEQLKLYYGLEFNRDYVRSNKQYLDKAVYDQFAEYLKGEYRYNKFLFGLGQRYTFVWLHENEGIEYIKNNIAFSGFIQYNYNKNYNIALNLAQGFRAPNLNDLTGNVPFNYGFEFGNDDLSAENSYSIELNQSLKFDKVSVNGAVYTMFLRDFIGRRPIDAPQGYESYKNVVEKTNNQKGIIYGAEIDTVYKPKSYISFKGGLSYTYGKMDEEIFENGQLVIKNNPMRRIPPLNGMFQINYIFKMIDFNYKFIFALKQDQLSEGDKADSRIEEGGTEGFGVHSVGAEINLSPLIIYLKFNNLLNETYKYHGSGIYGAGRSAQLQVSYIF